MPMPYAIPDDYDEDDETITPDGLVEIGLAEDPTRIHYRGSVNPTDCPTCGYRHVLDPTNSRQVFTSGLAMPNEPIDVRRHLRRVRSGRVSTVRRHVRRR